MMNKALEECRDADVAYAKSTGEWTFIRAAKKPEIELFNEHAGQPEGDGPRSLFVVVGEHRCLFVSWPRDVTIPRTSRQGLEVLLDEAKARGVMSVVIDPSARN